MKKIIRILGLIQIVQQKHHFSKTIRRQIIRKLLYLEYKSYVSNKSSSPVSLKIFQYVINGYGYENLRILFTEIFVHEEYQYFTGIGAGSIIVDAGANIGMATLYFKWRYPECIVHAFEPDPVAFETLSRNVKENKLSQVFLYNTAIMDEEQTLQFYISREQPASLMMSTLHNRMNEQHIEVPAIDLSAFIKKFDSLVLKIDIEGAEQKVFNKLFATGAIGKLKQFIMEYHHKIDSHPAALSDMLAIFEKSGFEYNMITQFAEPGKFQDILIYGYKPASASNELTV